MNRRGFLKFLGGAAATAAVAAPSVSYFFAPKGGWKQDDGGLWVANVPVLHTFDGMLMPTYPADMYSTGMWYCLRGFSS